VEQQTDWFTIAQAAASAAQEIAGESAQHRIEVHRLRALNQGKDNQIETLEKVVESWNRMRNRMKVLLDKIEFLQDEFENLPYEIKDSVNTSMGAGWSSVYELDIGELRKECGCGESDPG
jgi:hypothetical protein